MKAVVDTAVKGGDKMADVLKKVPVREQDPKVRATNFNEVCLGYNEEEAVEEAKRCLNCKNARCIEGSVRGEMHPRRQG